MKPIPDVKVHDLLRNMLSVYAVVAVDGKLGSVDALQWIGCDASLIVQCV